MNNNSNNDHSSPSDRQNVSFKFTKTTSKTLSGNKLTENLSEPTDYVLSVDKSEIKSTVRKKDEGELVIPLIRKNNWRTSNTSQKEEIDEESKIKELAIKEILNETSKKNAEWDNRESSKDFIITVPLIMQNQVPEGYETDEKMDVTLRPDESTLDDYDQVPVEKFGLAMLRGMGWKEGAAIGANNKQYVEPVQVQLRPKGLGLGADASVLKKSQKKAKEEKLELVQGAYVCMTQGPHTGHYGQILSLDEENARAIIKLSNSKDTKTFPEFFFNLVSKKEFDKESRIMNRDSYENFKRREEERLREEEDKEKRREENDSLKSREGKRKHHHSSDRESRESKKEHKRRSRSRERSEDKHSSSSSRRQKLWLRPQLKVRFIDDKYKKGRYFNKKLVVVDVMSQNSCSCKTEDDRTLLDDISPMMLETVIPRDESAYVMIVQGKYSGELCSILKKDKSHCVATVQFLSDRNKAMKIDYDSICEYVGDVEQYD